MLEWVRSLPLIPAIAFLMVVIYLRAGGTYALGRAAIKAADRGSLREILHSPRVNRAAETIHRYGAVVVALSFLTVGFQTACNLAAGVTRMPLRYYLPALAIGGFAWAVIYATVGLAALTLWWKVALTNPIIAGLILVTAISLLTWHILRRRAQRRVETAEAMQRAERGHTDGPAGSLDPRL